MERYDFALKSKTYPNEEIGEGGKLDILSRARWCVWMSAILIIVYVGSLFIKYMGPQITHEEPVEQSYSERIAQDRGVGSV